MRGDIKKLSLTRERAGKFIHFFVAHTEQYKK